MSRLFRSTWMATLVLATAGCTVAPGLVGPAQPTGADCSAPPKHTQIKRSAVRNRPPPIC